MRNFTLLKMMLVAIALVIGSVWVRGQVNIIPIHTGTISVFTSWSYTSCTTATISSNDYIKMISNTSKVITPSMNFSQYYNHKLDFKTATFGTVTDAKKTITISISTNNGIDWTTLGTRLPGTSTLTSVIQFDISSYTGNNILIKFESLGADGANGVRLDDIKISGIAAQTCTSSTLAFSNATLNKTMADAVFTQTATSLNGTTAITYTSNNTAVANVNEISGVVTLVGAGVSTITATQAAGTHSAVNYCASTATYSLNVASILPTITVTEVTVPAMVALVGNTVTETVNVKGENLTNNIGLALSGENATQFNLSTNSLPQSGGNVSNTAIIITYIPTQQGSHTATLTITSNGATSVLRTLTGTAYQLVGDGTTLNPYTVADVKTLNNSLGAVTKYWVLGYIIGVPSGGDGINLTTVDLDAPFASNSAIAISNTKNDADLSKMIAVQLPTGNVRNALNLVDNATVLNKWVKVYGTLEGYFSGTPGVKNTTEYLLESIGTGFNQLGDKLNIYVSENIIEFESSANETVSIYNTVGQKLVQKLTVNGMNTIPVSARGVVLVKVGNRFAKVIL